MVRKSNSTPSSSASWTSQAQAGISLRVRRVGDVDLFAAQADAGSGRVDGRVAAADNDDDLVGRLGPDPQGDATEEVQGGQHSAEAAFAFPAPG